MEFPFWKIIFRPAYIYVHQQSYVIVGFCLRLLTEFFLSMSSGGARTSRDHYFLFFCLITEVKHQWASLGLEMDNRLSFRPGMGCI